jgi:exopolysaccharide production protein ExoQ
MSILTPTRTVVADEQTQAVAHVSQSEQRELHKLRWNKIICSIALGICFWFSVPYQFPYLQERDPKVAAALESQAYEGSISRQISMPILFCVGLYMLWRLPRRGNFRGRLMVLALMYLSWATLSITWSADPAITGKRLIVFGIDAFLAFVIARTLSMIEMALLGFFATAGVALIALYVEFVKLAEFAPFDPEYRFMGVTTANYMAMSLVVCVFCALTLLEHKRRWAVWLVPSAIVALTLLVLTRSRVSTIIVILMLAIMLNKIARDFFTPHVRAMVLVGALAVVVPAIIYFVGKSGSGAAQMAFMMGRNDTQNTSNLSNRAPLWSELMESVERSPWLGVGYDGFWTPARVESISADQGWTVPHAHNTYLDQALSLGIIGAMFYAAMVWSAVVMAWRRYRADESAASLFAAVMLTWLALEGLAESVPLDPYLPTLLAYACIAKMCMVEKTEAVSVEEAETAPAFRQSRFATSNSRVLLLNGQGR